MPLNREQIREKSRAAIKTVDVPIAAFGGETIRLRQMTGGALVEYEATLETGTDGDNAFGLIQRCAVGDDNELLWPIGEEGSAEAVRELPAEAVGDLATAATRLHKISEKSVEEAAKN